jgi:hypothetical protein
MTSASKENGDLLIVFSVQGTGGSPRGPDPENRVGDQDIGSPGRPFSCGLQVPGEPGYCRARTPIATRNNLDRAEKNLNLFRRLAPLTYMIRFQAFQDPLRGELPYVQIFMNDGSNPIT